MNLFDLATRAGLFPKLAANTAGGEYHSACPDCGGTDRFYIQPNKRMNKCYGTYRCRKCGIYGDSISFAIKILNWSYKESLEVLSTHSLSPSSVKSFNHEYNIVTRDSGIPNDIWCAQAEVITSKLHEKLLNNGTVLEYLHKRGVSIDTIKQFRIGYNPETIFAPRSEWGLKESDDKKNVWIPRGIVIPAFSKNKVVRIKIRRESYDALKNKSRYICITGSSYGINLIENVSSDIVFVVESELDAYALFGKVADMASVISIGGSLKNPDTIVDTLIKRCKRIYVCHDNDSAGKKVYEKWNTTYRNCLATPVPVGKDIGEATEQGFDIDNWLFKELLFDWIRNEQHL